MGSIGKQVSLPLCHHCTTMSLLLDPHLVSRSHCNYINTVLLLSSDPHLVSRSHCHYVITVLPALVLAHHCSLSDPHLVSRSHCHFIITDRCWHNCIMLVVRVDDNDHFHQK